MATEAGGKEFSLCQPATRQLCSNHTIQNLAADDWGPDHCQQDDVQCAHLEGQRAQDRELLLTQGGAVRKVNMQQTPAMCR